MIAATKVLVIGGYGVFGGRLHPIAQRRAASTGPF
jgi:hypothetical protein